MFGNRLLHFSDQTIAPDATHLQTSQFSHHSRVSHSLPKVAAPPGSAPTRMSSPTRHGHPWQHAHHARLSAFAQAHIAALDSVASSVAGGGDVGQIAAAQTVPQLLNDLLSSPMTGIHAFTALVMARDPAAAAILGTLVLLLLGFPDLFVDSVKRVWNGLQRRINRGTFSLILIVFIWGCVFYAKALPVDDIQALSGEYHDTCAFAFGLG